MSDRHIPPASWQEPRLKPVYELFQAGEAAARKIGETALADCLKHLYCLWTHGRLDERAVKPLAELATEALLRAGERDEP